jgi:hypothetical protein
LVYNWYDDSYVYTTRGDAHHDLLVHCGHATDTYDGTRYELRTALSDAGHGWRSEYWGNTALMRQCDGRYTSSDGYVVWLRVDHFH